MLRRWLEDTPLSAFVAAHLGRAPFARPAGASAAIPLFDWSALARILAIDPRPDALVVARGECVGDLAVPRSLAASTSLMARGLGLVVRHAERCDAGLASLARSFEAELGGAVQIQLFVTPGGTHGFGWHHDAEHVFIAQTAGAKDYFFRPNTVSPAFEARPDFTRFHQERSPIATARLLAGDWLYIPARWWHVAKSVEDSLSISVGVRL